MFLTSSYHTSFVLDIKQDKLTSLMMKCKIRLSNNVKAWIDWSSVFSAMQGYVVVFLLIHECMHTPFWAFVLHVTRRVVGVALPVLHLGRRKKGCPIRNGMGAENQCLHCHESQRCILRLVHKAEPKRHSDALQLSGLLTQPTDTYWYTHPLITTKNPWLTISWPNCYSAFPHCLKIT